MLRRITLLVMVSVLFAACSPAATAIPTMTSPTPTSVPTVAPIQTLTLNISGRVCIDQNADQQCSDLEPGITGAKIEVLITYGKDTAYAYNYSNHSGNWNLGQVVMKSTPPAVFHTTFNVTPPIGYCNTGASQHLIKSGGNVVVEFFMKACGGNQG